MSKDVFSFGNIGSLLILSFYRISLKKKGGTSARLSQEFVRDFFDIPILWIYSV